MKSIKFEIGLKFSLPSKKFTKAKNFSSGESLGRGSEQTCFYLRAYLTNWKQKSIDAPVDVYIQAKS